MLNITLAAIALAAAYAVYYIRLAAAKVKKQTQQIEDEAARLLLDNAIEDVRNLAETAVGAMEQTTASALRDEVKIGKGRRSHRSSRRRTRSTVQPRTASAGTSILGAGASVSRTCLS